MKLVLGGPGCGKTTALLEIVEGHLSRGVSPARVGFFAFTRKASTEARDRMCAKFELGPDDVPYFRTLHSLAFKLMGYTSQQVMSGRLFKQFATHAELELSDRNDEEGALPFRTMDDRALTALSLARLTMTPLPDICEELDLPLRQATSIHHEYEAFKEARGVLDYTDMLEEFVRQGDPPRLDVLIVDEAQDLSTLQWRMVEILARHVDHVYIAGDDDQAIYEWAGADVAKFLSLKGERRVLPVSYRLKSRVYDVCASIVSDISQRFAKDWRPFEQGGHVERVGAARHLPLESGEWFLLARNKFLLTGIKRHLYEQGFPFLHESGSTVDNDNVRAVLTWESLRKGKPVQGDLMRLVYPRLRAGAIEDDFNEIGQFDPFAHYTMRDLTACFGLLTQAPWLEALELPTQERDYYVEVKRRGESLVNVPRIRVSTIHGVKGGEAENVFLVTDLARSTHEQHQRKPDTEARVFFVGASRAKERLYVQDPRSTRFFDFQPAGV